MTTNVPGTVGELDEVLDNQIERQLADGEAWDDAVAAVDWLATAKARARGDDEPEIQDVLWSLSTLELIPYTAHQIWWMSGVPDEDPLPLTQDDDRDAVQTIRAALFEGAAGTGAVPVTIPEEMFRGIDASLFEFLVPHPETSDVLVSLGELHYKLGNADDVVAYVDGLAR